jgi:hypothetical protein
MGGFWESTVFLVGWIANFGLTSVGAVDTEGWNGKIGGSRYAHSPLAGCGLIPLTINTSPGKLIPLPV